MTHVPTNEERGRRGLASLRPYMGQGSTLSDALTDLLADLMHAVVRHHGRPGVPALQEALLSATRHYLGELREEQPRISCKATDLP